MSDRRTPSTLKAPSPDYLKSLVEELNTRLEDLEDRRTRLYIFLNDGNPTLIKTSEKDYATLQAAYTLTTDLAALIALLVRAEAELWYDPGFRRCAMRCVKIHRAMRSNHKAICDILNVFNDWRGTADEPLYASWLGTVSSLEHQILKDIYSMEILLKYCFVGELDEDDLELVGEGFKWVDIPFEESCNVPEDMRHLHDGSGPL